MLISWVNVFAIQRVIPLAIGNILKFQQQLEIVQFIAACRPLLEVR